MKTPSIVTALVAACSVLASGTLSAGSVPEKLEWQRKPDQSWRESEIHTLESLDGFSPRETFRNRSRFGGYLDGPRREATGFFRTEKVDGRWWTIDPEGYPYIPMGMTSVRPANHKFSKAVFEEKFADNAAWAEATVELLRGLGFTDIGRWSRIQNLNEVKNRLPYTTTLGFMTTFGRRLSLTTPSYGHAKFRENAIPVFHPDFEAHAFEYAREQVEGLADDPWLLGHFTDNELPMPRDLLSRTLSIDADDPALGYNVKEAWRWFRARHGDKASPESVTDEDNLDWLAHVMDRYYAITTAALKAVTPNHMNLGSRLHGAGPHIPQVLQAAGRHLDIVSVNYYNVWSPSETHLLRWTENSAAPILITEFYVKGEDAAKEWGFDNSLGAGWVVRTQRNRGLWYQNYTLRLLESPHVVGWQYFKFIDERNDSNKGILNPRYELYRDLTDLMVPIHRNAWDLIEYFDRQRE